MAAAAVPSLTHALTCSSSFVVLSVSGVEATVHLRTVPTVHLQRVPTVSLQRAPTVYLLRVETGYACACGPLLCDCHRDFVFRPIVFAFLCWCLAFCHLQLPSSQQSARSAALQITPPPNQAHRPSGEDLESVRTRLAILPSTPEQAPQQTREG